MSSALLFERLRRGFGRGGRVTVASTMPPAVEGRPDDYRLAPSRLIEGTVLAAKGGRGADALSRTDGVPRRDPAL